MKPTVHQYALIALLLGGVAISGCSSTPSAEPVEEPVAQTEPEPVFVPVQKPTPEVTAVERDLRASACRCRAGPRAPALCT